MIKQVFKHEVLSRTRVRNNILKIWEATSDEERRDWYSEANSFGIDLAGYRIKPRKAFGVIAALSPVKRWEENKILARDMIYSGDCGHMSQFKSKARDILDSDGSDEEILRILNGRKISAFYLNITYPNKADYITIDRHALSVALGRFVRDEDYVGITAKQYEFFTQCYTLAAMKVGVSPVLMQSATWLKWRKIKHKFQ